VIPVSIRSGDARQNVDQLEGLIVAREFRTSDKIRFRKGHRLTARDLEAIDTFPDDVHAIRLEANDVHEDDAARLIAAMIRGDNLVARDPVQSRVNLVAARKGLLRVNPEAVFQVNRLPDMSVFTLPDRLPVLPGKIVAGAKITPVSIPESVLDEAAALLRTFPDPLIQVKPFLPHKVGVVVSEGLTDAVRDRFETALRQKIGWYGSEIIRFAHVDEDTDAVAQAIRDLDGEGATLILTAGGNMMDPFDASISALPQVGAEVIRYGAPAHPGSMFWLAWSDVPIFNVASCSMYSRATVADLVLPWVMAGEQVTADDLAWLGYGGLLDRDMAWRFPRYDVNEVDEPDEDA
jgi:hypothetical protein